MRVAPPGLLVLAVVSTVAACRLNSAGLGVTDAGRGSGHVPDGASVAITIIDEDASSGAGGTGGETSSVAGSGGGAGLAGSGGSAGLAGSGGSAGTGQAGTGGASGGGGDGGTQGMPDAHPVSPVGCADDTREGFKDQVKYSNIAACSGGWQVAGFVSPDTHAPQCDRQAGNDGIIPDGVGCSVADLCADGWHVCESAHEVSLNTADCRDALPQPGAQPAFFATRQRGPMKTCDPTNQDGTNNIFGCGNFGSVTLAACAPLTRMLRDADCDANPPWMCVNGPLDYSTTELIDTTKSGSTRGGVLCCR
jgi:hypothetical protein